MPCPATGRRSSTAAQSPKITPGSGGRRKPGTLIGRAGRVAPSRGAATLDSRLGPKKFNHPATPRGMTKRFCPHHRDKGAGRPSIVGGIKITRDSDQNTRLGVSAPRRHRPHPTVFRSACAAARLHNHHSYAICRCLKIQNGPRLCVAPSI